MTIELDGRLYTPDMVMGPPRKGIKVTYCTDSRPTDTIARYAEDADLFICEGMAQLRAGMMVETEALRK